MSSVPSAPSASYDAFLFDMDGTILSSIASAERIWGAWATRHGLEVETFLPTIHGVQSVETIRRLGLPGIDPVAEAAAITAAEIAGVDGITPIAGVVPFLAALPPERWAIVTSAPRALAEARLRVAGIARPAVLVTAEDVQHGKPARDCFLLAARNLGVDPSQCLVFEDAPAGIVAGEAAGAEVMVVTATHSRHLTTDHRSVADYSKLAVAVRAEKLILHGPG